MTGPVPVEGRAHSAYREPGGWTEPAHCHPDRAAAVARARGVTALAGPDAAARREWLITPCDGSTPGCSRQQEDDMTDNVNEGGKPNPGTKPDGRLKANQKPAAKGGSKPAAAPPKKGGFVPFKKGGGK